MGLNKKWNGKLIFISGLIIIIFYCLVSIYPVVEAGLANSAHDLSNESTSVSCYNCHWMHQKGTQDTTGDVKGFRHSLISQNTVWLCFVCHSGRDPDAQDGRNSLIVDGYLPANIVFKPAHSGKLFPGQNGINIYDVRKAYETAENAGNGSYHLYYSMTKYPNAFQDTSMPFEKFTCFDCHNHGVKNRTVPGGRLPKLLWSKGRYDSFGPFEGKNIDSILVMRNDSSQYYATEYFCLSCHSENSFPNKWKALDSLYWPAQIDDTAHIFSPVPITDIAFFNTKHTQLDRYGYYDTGSEPRNPFGNGKDISCLVCHNIHASTYPNLLRGNFDQNTMCQQCHSPSSPVPQNDTFEFSYIMESSSIYNYVTAGHSADKGYFTTYGHGRTDTSAIGVVGAGLFCSSCHGVHGTGHFKMVKTVVKDPRSGSDTTYILDSSDINDLDSLNLVSGFCAGACHFPSSPVRDLFWWQSASVFATTGMPSIYRGKGKFDLSAHNDVYNSAQDKAVCAACHDSHGTPYPALTWNSEEALCFQCHDSTMSGGAPNIKQYFNTLQAGRSHHPVDSSEQSGTKKIECISCHNPHMAARSSPVMNPFDWSTTGDTSGFVNFTTHKGRAGFCLTCHYEYYKDTIKGLGAYPPGVRMNSGSAKLIGAEFYNAGHNKRSDTTANYAVLIDCLNCHKPHGSTNPNNILDVSYFDTLDGDTDIFNTVFYNFNTLFAEENTRISRKFCYSPSGDSGCHTPQYLTSKVIFPDSLAVDTSHHDARKVPYGPPGNSYYIDEHDPYYDTDGNTPASGILGCSVCHYKPHNPTPDYWYNSSAAGAEQYCLDCHRPPAARPSGYETTAKYYGGAPSKYESTYNEFNSGSYLSKHLASAGIDSTTTGDCKKCHGEHDDHNIPGGNFVGRTAEDILTTHYRDSTGSITATVYSTTYGTFTDHLNSSSFCLSCHKDNPPGTFGAAVAPDIDIMYNSAGHGKLSSFWGSLPVYCFDCHTKHTSLNPSLLRTEIRNIVDYESARSRSVSVEDLDSSYKKSTNVRVDGIQAVCFACHTNAGAGYDTAVDTIQNALNSNPGSALWRGKAIYESAGHGMTRIPGYRDTTYGTTAAGLSCTWCHEPHGRGTNTAWVFNSTFNDDMLKIEGNVGLCLKCHDKVLTDTANNITISNIKVLFDNSVSRHNVYSVYSTAAAPKITCLNCHNPHTGDKEYPGVNPDDRVTLNVGDDVFCIQCHDGTPPASPYPAVVFPATQGSGYNKASYESSAHGEGLGSLAVWCRTCHRPHGTNKQYLQREVYDFNQDNIFGGHNYDSVYTTTAYGTTDYKDEDVCFGCHRNHSAEEAWSTGNVNGWPAEWAGIPDIYKLFYNTATSQPRPATHHNVLTVKQRGADSVWTTTGTSDDSFMECDNCHNQHVATKSKPITDPDNLNILLNTTGAELVRFCLRCHDNAPPAGVSRALQNGKFDNISSLYDPNHDGNPDNFFGHFSQNSGVAINCLVCHNTHGVLAVDRGLDSSNPAYYNNNIAFYHDNTKESRKFCYSADSSYTSGCHIPQYLTATVKFPDSLDVSSSTHARNVPYGPLGNSYYIDEHNPYYDIPGNTTASGISGCSVCHYKPHRPSPNGWYDSSAKGAAQYCLDCHRPPAGGSDTANSKYFGGAPSKYESTYLEFTSTVFVSKHFTGAINQASTGYCKKCHGEHTDHNVPWGIYVRRMNIATVGTTTVSSGPFNNYLDSTSFCLSCHQGDTTYLNSNTFGGGTPPNIAVLYNTSGHGKLKSASGSLPVYCFDCHSQHSSENPSMLRTEIRDVIGFESARNRNIRVKDLDSAYKKTANVKTDGVQYVCFACHTGAGSDYDSSNNDTVNALRPNPGSALWLGKAIYESAGHGMTRIPGFRDTTYGSTATGMSCTWCHEPHGRGVNSTAVNWRTAYDSSINDDMLLIEGSVYLCLKCHNQVLNDTANNLIISNIKVLFDSSVSRHNVYSTAAVRITCLNCHNPHTGDKQYPGVNPDSRTTLNVGDDVFCIQCHDGTPPTYAGGNPYPNVAFSTTSGTGYNKASYESSAHGVGMNGETVWCRTCHKPHGTNKKKLLREVYDFNQDNNLGGRGYDSVYTDYTTYAAYGTAYIDYKDEEVCFGCHRNHTGEGDWNTAWADIPDVLRFYKVYDSGTNTYGAKTRSHHPIYADEQRGPDSVYITSDDKKIECEDCHNQHVATRSKPITDPDSTNRLMSAYGTDCITFCLRCHDNKAPAGIKGLTWGQYKNIAAEYDPDTNGIYENFTGHYRQSDGTPLECRVCHSMHGSNFSKQIREDVVDGVEVLGSDTGKLVRNMFALTLDQAHLGGNDTLALSSSVEICLSCHSGKTQFYDAAKGAWQDIPLAPPPVYDASVDTTDINTSIYHPYLLDASTASVAYLDYADTGRVRKKVKSIYSTVFNIDTTKPFASSGCACHGAHNPYKEPTSEFMDCFNCHNSFSNIVDIDTQFHRVVSKHSINYNSEMFNSTGEIQYMECFKCHIQFEIEGDTTYYHRIGTVVFVDVNSGTTWASRTKGYDNTSKKNVTLFCLSCHNNPLADPDSPATYYGSTANSPYRFTDTATMKYGGDPVQLRALDSNDLVQRKPNGRYYYPVDTASAHFDTSFGTAALISGFSCTDCHDPHGSINNSLLQDFEEYVDRKDYDRDGNTSRVINYESVNLYKLNEEKFCYYCHDAAFNTTGWNRGKQMKNIQSKFSAAAASRHKVDDAEQAAETTMIECTNCHNPHTARRDRLVVNPKTGERAEVGSNTEMNNFCLGCHDTGGPGTTAVIPTNWDSGIKFPSYPVNTNNAEWVGNTWNKYNKESMRWTEVDSTGLKSNKHYSSSLGVSCVACHDSHGSSNYRMLAEEVVNAFNTTQTTYIYGITLRSQTKPDGRVRTEAYSTAGYSMNRFCFACHKAPMGYDPDYPRNYVYPGDTAYNAWDFGTTKSAPYDKINGIEVVNQYGKDKDCDYCHNPHSSDSVRVHMVRDTVPQDLNRLAATYGNRIADTLWFGKTGDTNFAATGVDFCLSKGCHNTDRWNDLGSGVFMQYDQFNLLPYGSAGALTFSGKRSDAFTPDGVKYTAARTSKHPIVTYNENRALGNTLVCISCHTPHGSPGNTELAASYGNTYESTYPQDNAGLRRAYYRGIYWWPASLRKASDALGMYSPDTTHFGAQDTVKTQNIPLAGNDICFECHIMTDIIGTVGGKIDSTRTRFIGHEAVVGGAQIGATIGLRLKSPANTTIPTPNDYHKFTCSFCHGPHATTDEKLLTMKCYYTSRPAPVGNPWVDIVYRNKMRTLRRPASDPYYKPPYRYRYSRYWRNGIDQYYFRPAGTLLGPVIRCHSYANNDWSGRPGWRTLINTAKNDLDRPTGGIDTLYVYANTTKVYDTLITVPDIGLQVRSNDMDVVLAWRSVYDSGGGNSTWAYAYNIYRGDTALTKQNKFYKAKAINTWLQWGYTLVNKVYDTGYAARNRTDYATLYTIDPSIAHVTSKRYYYLVVPTDIQNNEAIVEDCLDTGGIYFPYDSTPPREITTLILTQEYQPSTNTIGMRITWQDPGDNIHTSTYVVYAKLLDSGQAVDTSYFDAGTRWAVIPDTSAAINTDSLTAGNFGDFYNTVRYDSSLFNSLAVINKKVYIVGIRTIDKKNNTCSVFAFKSLRLTDAVPANITCLTARPNIAGNLSGSENNYNINLSWTVPWDNAQPAVSIPVYKVYRRLGQPIDQADIDNYNFGTTLTDVECITSLTRYNGQPVSAYNTGVVIYYTDNVVPSNILPGQAYYYAVTPVDVYATLQVNLSDTAYGYHTDRVGYLYREQMNPALNTRLLDPIDGSLTNYSRINTQVSFIFSPAEYDISRFKQYNFYRRYETSKIWELGTNPQTQWRNTGIDSVQANYPAGNYYYAASVVYNSTYITIGGNTRWFTNLESPLNLTSMIFIQDLVPPAPFSFNAAFLPMKENGYDTIKLSWSGGTDTANFKNYNITQIRGDGAEIDSTVSGLVSLWHMNTTWVDSRSANNGTAYNNAYFNYSPKFGSACGAFDGLFTYVSVPNAASLQVTGDMSIEFWLYPQIFSSDRLNPIDKSYIGEFSFTIETDGSLTYNHGDGSNYTSFTMLPPGAIQNNQWIHIALTRNDSTKVLKGYKNGQLVSTLSGYSCNPSATTEPLIFGMGYTAYGYRGLIDEVALYNRVLTEGEISGHSVGGTIVASYTDMSASTFSFAAPSPSIEWQTTNNKYGAFKYKYTITANDSALNYSQAITSLATRPPSNNNMNLAVQALSYMEGIRVSWANMLQYSEFPNYGAGGYKIYSKHTSGPAETINHIFYGTTLNVDTAYGVVKVGEVTADTTGSVVYPKTNQALFVNVTASSYYDSLSLPSKVNDNNLTSSWFAAEYDTFSTTFIELDLGTDKVIDRIVYDNYGDGMNTDPFDTVQGYMLLAASRSQYLGGLWETVTDYPGSTPRQRLVFQRQRTGIRYIRATNFSHVDTMQFPAAIFEIEAYYPNDTSTTSFEHLYTNANLPVESGRWYTYGITLEDKSGTKSLSVFLPNSISVMDVEPPGRITLMASLFPALENGYNSVGLSWSGGRDSNFRNYVITRVKHDTTESADTEVANLSDMLQTTWTSAAPVPSPVWQAANNKYGAFRYLYKIRAYDTANNYSEASTTLVTRPPSANMNFLAQSLTAVTGVRLSWNNMLTYSETTNYGVGGYKVYAKKANNQSDTLSRIFQPGTFNLETGVYKLGEVTVDTTGLPSYATTNQAVYATATASSSYSGSYQPINIKDGSLNTLWRSANSESTNAWIQLAFSSDVVIEKIVYNNYGNGSLFDTAQGYILLAASAAQNSTGTWETVANKPGTTQRGNFVYQRAPRTPVKYIRATNFSRSGSVDTTVSPAAVFELEAYYPNDTTTTTFIHLGTNGYLAAEAGKWYAYGITLEDKAGNKGAPVFSTTSIAVLDVYPPQPVIDLVAYGLEGSSNIYLKWSQPYDNLGVKNYEVWRRNISDILSTVNVTLNNINLGTTSATNYTNAPGSGTYFYAVAALDSAGNKSKFSGTNYSAGATVGLTRDSTPPEPITLATYKFDTATRNRVQLTWSPPSNPALDKKDYDTLFNADTTLYPGRITQFFVYRVDNALDSMPFTNKFSSISGRDTFDNGTGGVANGWSAGVWGGSNAPTVLPGIVYDAARGSNVQQLNIYNYSGDPKEKIPANPKYIKTAAYIKSTGYQFDSSQALNDTLAVRYLFGLWLKAEGAVSGQPYRGTVYLDAATRLNTGNESTFISLGRREVINPSMNWTYYLLNLRMPADTTYSSTENGVMVWAANNGNIWLDDAELVKLGKPFKGVGSEGDGSGLYYDTSIVLNNDYHYVVTALDISSDPTGGNEGRFANIGKVSCDIRAPVFDTVIFELEADPDPADPADANKTGTTPSIKFMSGLDPTTRANTENHLYDSDNIFRNGDAITLQFKMLVPSLPPVPKLDILPDGMIIGDFYNMDSSHFTGAEDRYSYGNGTYRYRYIFDPYTMDYAPDTPYNTTMNKYESLYQIKVFVRDGNGNGPSLLGRDTYADSDTTDNNFDTTYQAILDNTAPSYPE